jgi:hypothetical protein
VTATGRQALLGQAGEHRLEALLLERVEAVVLSRGGIGAGQMGVEARQLDGLHALHRRHQPRSLLPVGAEAGHAGVQLQLHGHGAAAAAGQVLAEQGFPHAAEGGHQLPAQAAAQFLGLGEVAEHQHRSGDAGAAQLQPFAQGGDPETGRPRLQGGAGHGQGAVAVGVGLDHRHQLGGRPMWRRRARTLAWMAAVFTSTQARCRDWRVSSVALALASEAVVMGAAWGVNHGNHGNPVSMPRIQWTGMGHVLVLNASYEPLNITTWRRAMVMLLKGKAEGLEHDPERRSVRTMICPR